MVPDPHGPPELRHGVVEDNVPQMAFTLQSVASQGARRADAGAYAHRNRIPGVVDVCDVLSGWLEDRVKRIERPRRRKPITGRLICNLVAANFSPGASNATTGAPNVTPTSEANEPPNECPMTQMFASGYR
jgi:hypothetical protein